MSRHEIPALVPRYRVFVGWDHPLQSYFGIVYDMQRRDGGSDLGAIVLWCGGVPPRLDSIDELQREIRRYAMIPSAMRATLSGDRGEGC